jgi:hypothetical protein
VFGSLGAATAAAGVVLALVLVRSGESEATPTQSTQRTVTRPATTEKKTNPVEPRPIVEEVAISKQGETVTAAIQLSGPKLDPGGLVVRDKEIADGRASFQLRQGNIATRIGRRSSEGLTAEIASVTSRLIFTFSAASGAFTEMLSPRIVGGGRSVEVSFVEAPPPATTSTATTSPPPPPPPPPPSPASTKPDIG